MKKQRSQMRPNSRKPTKDIVLIELDIKCSCPQSTSNENAAIQFTRRYLRCQSSMSIRILRLLIERILLYSPTTQVSIFDSHDRLLKDSDRLRSLKRICSSSPSYCIPIRFALMNNVTSFANCSCLSPSIELNSSSSSLPTIIRQESIEQILSTCSIISQIPSLPSRLLSLSSQNFSNNPMNFSYSQNNTSLKFIDSNQNMQLINQRISEFGDISSTLMKRKQYDEPKTIISEISLDIPLDLTIKKHCNSLR
ncbi:unnamed protein product [Rotaria magnacalcarata]|uniref:Uncharacterized protein n=2 Tax=Rotaria magnacalcarata TaxID=392030 RepID=A0A815R7S9_9BILA|nr:unnamed protein product [Rotaria magnacalcarata]CAF2029448.1 unnamed protein product [Rotaria magnacalcarata]CAF3790434.1 unnamed protein product [Rotaria magnacalcarata]